MLWLPWFYSLLFCCPSCLETHFFRYLWDGCYESLFRIFISICRLAIFNFLIAILCLWRKKEATLSVSSALFHSSLRLSFFLPMMANGAPPMHWKFAWHSSPLCYWTVVTNMCKPYTILPLSPPKVMGWIPKIQETPFPAPPHDPPSSKTQFSSFHSLIFDGHSHLQATFVWWSNQGKPLSIHRTNCLSRFFCAKFSC